MRKILAVSMLTMLALVFCAGAVYAADDNVYEVTVDTTKITPNADGDFPVDMPVIDSFTLADENGQELRGITISQNSTGTMRLIPKYATERIFVPEGTNKVTNTISLRVINEIGNTATISYGYNIDRDNKGYGTAYMNIGRSTDGVGFTANLVLRVVNSLSVDAGTPTERLSGTFLLPLTVPDDKGGSSDTGGGSCNAAGLGALALALPAAYLFRRKK